MLYKYKIKDWEYIQREFEESEKNIKLPIEERNIGIEKQIKNNNIFIFLLPLFSQY